MHPLLVRTRPVLGNCPECSAGFTERVSTCPVCEEELEWCECCGKQITEDNPLIESESACQACAVYPCSWCGQELPVEDQESMAMEDVGGGLPDEDGFRVCAYCQWEDRNP